MENGSFQAPFSELSSLDFRDEQLPPTPNRVPVAPETRVKSSTVEALLAQNEDLMARLKVTLRRLTSLENENEQLRAVEQEIRLQNVSLSDQLLVWKEKEHFWHQKNAKLESQMTSIRERFPELEQMEEKLERYKKYHEKVRTQVKPYIQQLKAFAQSLTLEIRKLTAEIEEKEVRRVDIEKRLRALRAEVDDELRRQDEQNRQLVQIFENEKDNLRTEAFELRVLNQDLQKKLEILSEEFLARTNALTEELQIQREELTKEIQVRAQKAETAQMRQDELENMLIALRRSKEEAEAVHRIEMQARQQEIQELRKLSFEDDVRIKDVSSKLKTAQEEASRQSSRADQLEEQLTSLRYLWTNKCEEAEKLQVTVQSLEKLNQELSHRLNQARKGEASL